MAAKTRDRGKQKDRQSESEGGRYQEGAREGERELVARPPICHITY